MGLGRWHRACMGSEGTNTKERGILRFRSHRSHPGPAHQSLFGEDNNNSSRLSFGHGTINASKRDISCYLFPDDSVYSGTGLFCTISLPLHGVNISCCLFPDDSVYSGTGLFCTFSLPSPWGSRNDSCARVVDSFSRWSASSRRRLLDLTPRIRPVPRHPAPAIDARALLARTPAASRQTPTQIRSRFTVVSPATMGQISPNTASSSPLSPRLPRPKTPRGKVAPSAWRCRRAHRHLSSHLAFGSPCAVRPQPTVAAPVPPLSM